MTFTTTKEDTMKSTYTHKLARLVVALGALGTYLAASGDAFAGSFSDQTLKREIQPVESALAKLRTI